MIAGHEHEASPERGMRVEVSLIERLEPGLRSYEIASATMTESPRGRPS